MEFINSLEFIDIFPYGVLIVFVIFFINLAYMINLRNFFKVLESADPEKYKELSTNKPLGAISVVDMFNNSDDSYRYFKEKEYENLEDEEIKKLANRVRLLFLIAFPLTTAAVSIAFIIFFIIPILYSILL